MFTFRRITPLLAGLLLLTGCINITTGSGVPVSSEYDFTGFDAVAIEHAFKGTITRGDEFRVFVSVDDNLADRLKVEQDGNRLTIGFTETIAIGNANLRYEIEMPALTVLEMSGASQAEITGFASTDDFRATASGASRIEGDISSGDLDANASGASTIELTGSGGDARLDASGASTIDLSEFTTGDTNAQASGASTVTVNTNGRLDAGASGASHVYYLGQPLMGSIDESGGSSVEAR